MSVFRKFLVSSSAVAIVACADGGVETPPRVTPVPPVTVAPIASFTATVEAGTVPLEVTFSDTSSPGTSPITTYLWDFGDGTTSIDADPTHVYLVAGDYDVQLTVTTSVGSDGETATDFIDVDVGAVAVDPTEIADFDIDGVSVEAASKQVLVFLVEDVTEAQLEGVYARAEELGAGIQVLDVDFRMIQLAVSAGEELAIAADLNGVDGVLTATLNDVIVETRLPGDDNARGYKNWLASNPVVSTIGKILGGSPKVTIDSSFTGGYWIDQIGLEAGLTALEGIDLAANTIAIVDTGLPAGQTVIAESRVRRLDYKGNALTDDTTFGSDFDGGEREHGRDVLAFAAGDTSGATGVNSHSDLLSVDVYNPKTFFGIENPFVRTFRTDLNDGIRVAINEGASVVNVSFGDGSKCANTQSSRLSSRQKFRQDTTSVVEFARRKNVNLVFSAGNNCEKQDDQILPDAGDIDADSWSSHALIVAASDSNRNDACFTRMGKVVDLAAPGESVGFGNGSAINGTSFSTPIVTGSLGLIRSINATLSAPEARAIINDTVSNNFVSLPIADHQVDTKCTDPDTGAFTFPSDTTRGTTPGGILNFAGAVETALLAKDIDLTSLEEISLGKGDNQTVAVEITLPEDGVSALDLVFLIDRSGSYGDDIDTLQAQAESIISTLGEKDISIQYAVASFSDFDQSPFGSSGDSPFELLQALTPDNAAVIAAINRLDQPLQSGGDGPESQYEALFRTASGGVDFREGALPVILFATDADFHDSDTNTSYPGAGRGLHSVLWRAQT